jgi:putative ABC transport system permease protein
LFGLATFTAELRIKEIVIRKVMGASVQNILSMLNKDFLRLVVIANLLAWPVTAWLMDQWLSQFAYHTTLPWWSFGVAGTCTIVIAFVSVSSRALRAAKGDPVNSLRDE